MRSASARRRARRRLLVLLLFMVLVGLIAGVPYLVKVFQRLETGNLPVAAESSSNAGSDSDQHTTIRIAAAGDIMFHQTQLDSAYDANSKTYDFKSVFEDIKPIISAADLAIANFETTAAGSSRPYSGYPVFNSPDEAIDAIKYAGFDVLTTANNHSLDTGSEGLKRTVEAIQSKGIDTVGTYNKKPESRVLMKDVKGIKVAILSYTESTNGLGSKYAADELNAMINMMDKTAIVKDIREAKQLGADIIISLMHWGDEYVEQPNAKQIEFAQLMAKEGADIILGSHPHVIQKSEFIETADKSTFVIYSMGNFISNQRRETLDSRNELTEDGIIVNIDIRKDNKTNETTIQHVEYVPTWVYRDKEEGQSKYTYRILPVESYLDSNDISAAFKQRMKRSRDATVSKMDTTPIIKN
ncbi:CapA family protein [Paenibacillus sp. GXUN7292]|uniref:CapA family protein n=1 Tax=Paenibacillus sp. GXUN7292 TaxID=3422499 RepID=UPI003D7E95A8